MEKPFKNLLYRALWLASFSWACMSHARGAEAPKEPLPLTVFKNLQAGRKQTVVVYGTSLTAQGEWPKALQGYFDKQFPGLVAFINGAMPGKPSGWGVANVQARVLAHQPDLVFIEFAINDASTKNKTSLEQSAANLNTIVKAVRAQNPQADIVLMTMNPAWDPPARTDKHPASERPNLETYYEGYRRYAGEHKLPLVDVYPNWVKVREQELEKFQKWTPDGLHPKPEGSLAVTWPAIEMMLEKTRKAAAEH